MLVAGIFNQLSNSMLIWKSASKHHHHVLLLHWTHLYVVAVFPLWCSSQVITKLPAWGTQKRQNRDFPGHWVSWQGLAASTWRKWLGIRNSPYLMEGAWLSGHPPLGMQLQALSTSAWWGWCLVLSSAWGILPLEETCLCRKHGRWRRDGELTRLSAASCLVGPQCKPQLTSMEPSDYVTTSVALSKTTQDDMLQTPWSSQTNPSLWNCCMQIPTL